MKLRKTLTFLLLFAMLLGALPLYAFATDEASEPAAQKTVENGINIAVDSDLAIKYHAAIDSAEGKTLKASFGTTEVNTYTKDSDGRYVFTFDGLGPHQINDAIDIKVYANDAVVASKDGFTIKSYCDALLSEYPEDTALKQLVTDLLVYAKAADTYLNGQSDIAIAESLTPSSAVPTESDNKMSTSGNTAALYIAYAGVEFNSQNRLFFKVSSEGGKFTAEIDGKTYSADELDMIDGYYVIYSDAIAPTAYSDVKTLTVNEGALTASISYSADSYAYRMQNDEAMSELAVALYRYGKACEEYICHDIIYNVNSGTLPDSIPTSYDPDAVTILPTPTRDGYKFAGWYTTATFDEGTRTDRIAAGTNGKFTVYAKWSAVFISTDFAGSALDHASGNKEYAGITLVGKSGSSFKTLKDENGTEYLEWVKGSSDSLFAVTNRESTTNFANIPSTSVSYTFKLRKKADTPVLSTSQIQLESNMNMAGASGVWRAITLFKIAANGDIVCGSNNTVVGTITEDKITELNLVVDFKDSKFIYYSDSGKEIGTYSFALPANTDAKTTLEWQKLITRELIYFRADNNNISADSALMIYEFSITEGNVVKDRVPAENEIVYETNGGTLPEGAPKVYAADTATALPTPENGEALFAGWYTTESFDEGTRITSIPAGSKGAFYVYARWTNRVFINTDFAGSALNHTTASTTYAGITMNAYSGASFTTKTDENGKEYLEWVKGSSDSVMAVTNRENSGNFADMSETSASYSFKLRKKTDTAILSTSQIQLESNMNMAGASSVWRAITLFKIAPNGDVVCGADGSTVIATITEDKITEINLVVDFKESKFIFYSEDGAEIGRFTFALPQNTDATTALEWQKLITRELIYIRADNNSIPADSALMIYGFTIAEGNIFA